MKLVILCMTMCAAAVAAQPTFRTAVELVELDVAVVRGGKPVNGLTARDFVLTDNGVRQEVTSVTLEQLPLGVTLVLDASESVLGERLDNLRHAAGGLAQALRADDQLALITFSHVVRERVAMSADKGAVSAALTGVKGEGATALRDALHLALAQRLPVLRRPLVLLFTDGRDTASWLTEEDVLEMARRTGIVTHIVRVNPRFFFNAGPSTLKNNQRPFEQRLAEITGGRVWSASNDRELEELFTRALDEMRARYLLAYSPSGDRKPGWHEIKLGLRNGRADITTRPGYFVP